MRQGLTIFLIFMALLYLGLSFYVGKKSTGKLLDKRNEVTNFKLKNKSKRYKESILLSLCFLMTLISLMQAIIISDNMTLIDVIWFSVMHFVIIFTLWWLKQDIEEKSDLTQQVKNQTYENDALFRLVAQMLPHAIFMTRLKDDVILYVNSRASSLFLLEITEMIGSHAHMYYADWKSRVALKQEIMEAESAILERELLFRRHDGTTFIGQFSVQRAKYNNEEVLLFAISDVTMQRSLEKAVTQSEQLLRRLMDAIPDFIVVTDLSGNITYINEAVVELLADHAANILDLGWVHLEEVKTHLVQSYEDIHRFEVSCVDRKGDSRILGIHANVIHDSNQKPYSVIYVMRDVTKRREMEQQLIYSKQEIERINEKLLQANTKLTQRTIRDSLTGLFNLKHINALLTKEIQLRKQQSILEPLSVMMLDIDHFKSVNDEFGHLVGDEVLIYVARTISSCLRSNDLSGRYGGEEFVVVLPNTNLKQAQMVAERIRKAIEETIMLPNHRGITISIGVAELEMDDEVRDLVKRADTLLYQAKANGRNRVESEVEKILVH